MSSNPRRVPLDGDLVGYWGFDESLETDPAIDLSGNNLNLTVANSPAVAVGRVANGRDFNGSTSYATVTSAELRIAGDLTLISWARLRQYNSAGSLLRSLVSCAGPATGDGVLYQLGVTSTGALRYKHSSASGEVLVTTAPGIIRTNQLYNIVVQRMASGSGQVIQFFVDNVQRAVASVTVAGTPSSFPVPVPSPNASAVFSVARSQKESDSAYWDGVIDEVSVHKVARPYHAYLVDAYFRAALRSTTTKLSATNNVVAVTSAEMGAGVRWWCFERNRDLYVVRESPFGFFETETRLTTVGSENASLTGTPELLYDSTTDTLYVFFLSGGRIFKLTASSTDAAGTVNMPFTADTGSIIKSLENADGGRVGEGGSNREVEPEDITYVNRQPLKFNFEEPGPNMVGEGGSDFFTYVAGTPNTPVIALVTRPVEGFGVAVGPVDAENGGYRVYRLENGVWTLLAAPTLKDGGTIWFVPLTRQYGAVYAAEALTAKGQPSGIFSEGVADYFNEAQLRYDRWLVGLSGDGWDSGTVGEGGSQREVEPEDITYVNRGALKLSLQDPDTNVVGEGGGQEATVTQNGVTTFL